VIPGMGNHTARAMEDVFLSSNYRQGRDLTADCVSSGPARQ
jgi:hypothetical protein